MKGTRLKRVCIFILLGFSVELQLTVLGEETAYTCDSPTCSQDGEYFGDEGNCSSFYVCKNEIAFHFTCPLDLKFNPKNNLCDYSVNVLCPTGCIKCPANCKEQYFPDPTDCSNFYQCSNGVPVLKKCPDELYFNPSVNTCDWPQNVHCTNNQI